MDFALPKNVAENVVVLALVKSMGDWTKHTSGNLPQANLDRE